MGMSGLSSVCITSPSLSRLWFIMVSFIMEFKLFMFYYGHECDFIKEIDVKTGNK